MKIYKALTIAGSDSGAGAGLQADLKTFAALGVYGTSVVTAITAQNTTGVTRVLETPAPMVAAQIDAVMSDIGADAVKTGMLANARIIRTVADKVQEHGIQRLVVDPVMVAKGGHVLLRPDAIRTLRTRLFPLATVVTPNLPEAQALTGVEGTGVRAIKEMARHIVGMGARSVVVKGGHRKGAATDVFLRRHGILRVSGPARAHEEHPRHRLHLLGRSGLWLGPEQGAGNRRRRGQRVHHPGHPPSVCHRRRAQPCASFSRVLGHGSPPVTVVSRFNFAATGHCRATALHCRSPADRRRQSELLKPRRCSR